MTIVQGYFDFLLRNPITPRLLVLKEIWSDSRKFIFKILEAKDSFIKYNNSFVTPDKLFLFSPETYLASRHQEELRENAIEVIQLTPEYKELIGFEFVRVGFLTDSNLQSFEHPAAAIILVFDEEKVDDRQKTD